MRVEYQLEVKVWQNMENMHNKHLKHKPNIVNAVSICIYTLLMGIITLYLDLYQTACVKVAVVPALECGR